MAKQNYSFEKRQRELAKKKKEEKRLQKLKAKEESAVDEAPATADTDPADNSP